MILAIYHINAKILIEFFLNNREDWVAAIKAVADRLGGTEEMDTDRASVDGGALDELSAKFSVQGMSSSKTSGKKKVVSKIQAIKICCYLKSSSNNATFVPLTSRDWNSPPVSVIPDNYNLRTSDCTNTSTVLIDQFPLLFGNARAFRNLMASVRFQFCWGMILF